MEQEESKMQASIQFRCRKIVSAAAAEIVKAGGDQDSKNSIESPTPDKLESRSRIKGPSHSPMKGKQLFEDSHVEDAGQSERMNPESNNYMNSSKTSPYVLISLRDDDLIELPEEYETLSVLFERMNTSIRLLALRKKLPTFRNISTQVEVLSKRKFLCSHLAQMKYAFPEAIQIEKILLHDERSLCMISDMKVTIVKEVIECHLNPDQSASAALCKAFRRKLLDLFKSYPDVVLLHAYAYNKGTGIPQAVLPELFNSENHIVTKMSSMASSKEPPQETSSELVLSSASHFPSSFHQQFSQKIISETENIEAHAFPAPLLSTSTDEGTELGNNQQMKAIQSPVSLVRSPARVVYTQSLLSLQTYEFTPAKSSIGNAFITKTPSLQTPERPVPTTHQKFICEDEKLVSEPELVNLVCRSLIFGPSEVDESLSGLDACTSAQNGVRPHAYIKTTRRNQASDTTVGVSENHSTNQARQEKHANSRGCLLGMFDTICLILRSTDCSFITKQELVHKIILHDLDIEETKEVEDQLQLLEKLVPDWISATSVSNGDCFYCIKQAYDRESVRARLVEAA